MNQLEKAEKEAREEEARAAKMKAYRVAVAELAARREAEATAREEHKRANFGRLSSLIVQQAERRASVASMRETYRARLIRENEAFAKVGGVLAALREAETKLLDECGGRPGSTKAKKKKK